jgi:predicted GIY-YIG superfamily endonuclease
MTSTEYIYVLQLQDGRFYVGSTNDVGRRWLEHATGIGSSFTSVYKPISIVDIRIKSSPYDEDNITKEYMAKYGIQFVRGGTYTTIQIPANQEAQLLREIRTSLNQCYICGSVEHYASQCPMSKAKPTATAKKMAKPAKKVHWMAASLERDLMPYLPSYESSSSSSTVHNTRTSSINTYNYRGDNGDDSGDDTAGVCYRCGRAGHIMVNCYAKTHISGALLE